MCLEFIKRSIASLYQHVTSFTERREIFQTIGSQVVFGTKVSEWGNMMHVQSFAILFLMNATRLAGVIVSLTGKTSLLIPVWATIAVSTRNDLRQSIAFSRTILSAKMINLVFAATKRFPAYLTCTFDRGANLGILTALFCPISLLALPGAKRMFACDMTRAALERFSALIAGQLDAFLLYLSSTFVRTSRCFCPVGGMYSKHNSTNRAWYKSVIRPAKHGAKLSFIYLGRFQPKLIAASKTTFVSRWASLTLSFCCGTFLAPDRPIHNEFSAVRTGLAFAIVEPRIKRHICLQIKTLFAGASVVLAEGTRMTGKECQKQYMRLAHIRQTVFPQRLHYTTGVVIGEMA